MATDSVKDEDWTQAQENLTKVSLSPLQRLTQQFILHRSKLLHIEALYLQHRHIPPDFLLHVALSQTPLLLGVYLFEP